MSTRGIRRGPSIIGNATATNAPIFVDSDDNRLKYNPYGTGTTEASPVAGASAQIYLTDATVTLVAAQSGQVSIATKASATQTFTLPSAAIAGLVFTFIAGHADGEVLVNPITGQTMLIKATEDAGASIATSAGAGIKNTAATNVIGDHITLISDGVSQWYMIGQSGVWAAQ